MWGLLGHLLKSLVFGCGETFFGAQIDRSVNYGFAVVWLTRYRAIVGFSLLEECGETEMLDKSGYAEEEEENELSGINWRNLIDK